MFEKTEGDSTLQQGQPHSDTDAAIDRLARRDALAQMLASHLAAAATVQHALAEIDAAADAVAGTLAAGGVLHYAAAGSSGLMALADASELPGTFSVPQHQVRIVMAGGVPVDAVMPGNTEDDEADAHRAAQSVAPGDIALVLSASGATPFALAFARSAQAKGAKVISIANARGSALLKAGDIAILLETGPEVIAGSTRLGAGTAQKIALNMISSQAGVLLGHVHDGLMINLQPDNIKLRKRASEIVQRISGASAEAAEAALQTAAHNTKLAVLLAAGAEVEPAKSLLANHGGRLRDCLAQFDKTQQSNQGRDQ